RLRLDLALEYQERDHRAALGAEGARHEVRRAHPAPRGRGMKFVPLELEGAHLVELEPHRDERGFFARAFCSREFARHGLNGALPQINVSFNDQAGTLRGMHFQREPHGETKVVRCTSGAIYDVIVDLRPASTTFKRWFGTELSGDNRRSLY